MLITEQEASAKWCPMVRSLEITWPEEQSVAKGPFNEGPRPQGNVSCIASRCMMWRERGKNDDGEPVGYCGLAGVIL
jgi:hypothetical protein